MPEKYEPEISSSSLSGLPLFLMEDDTAEDSLWEMLNVYADGEANEAEREEMDRLLQSDPILARELNFFQTTHQILAQMDDIAPPAALRHSILSATSQRLTLRRRVQSQLNALRRQTLPIWGRYALPVGSVALIAGLSYGVFTAQNTRTTSQTEVMVAAIPQADDTGAGAEIAPKVEPLFPQASGRNPAIGTAKSVKTAKSATGGYRKEMTSKSSNRVPTLLFNGGLQSASLHRPPSRKPLIVDRLAPPKGTQPPREVAYSRVEITPLPTPGEFTPKPMMDKANQKPKEPVAMPAAFTFTENNSTSGTTEAASATTPRVITAELSPEQRRKTRIEQARLLLKDANKPAGRSSAEVSYHGSSDEDATKVVDNLKKLQSSAFVFRRF